MEYLDVYRKGTQLAQLASLLLVVLILVNCAPPLNTSAPGPQEGAVYNVVNINSDDSGVVAGALRFDTNMRRWEVIEDDEHQSINILKVVTHTDSIEVIYTQNFEVVISLIAAPDEQYAQAGVLFGASVGTQHALIYYNKNSIDFKNKSANIWIYGIFKKQGVSDDAD